MAGPGVRRETASRDADGCEAHGNGMNDSTAPPAGDDEAEAAVQLPVAIVLRGEDRSVASGRRFVRDMLGRRHPAVDKVSLGVSELATNAIKHTPSGDGGEIKIRLTVTGPLVRAEVTNDGSTMPDKPRTHYDPDAEDGRGILIVETLAESWGVTEHAGATTVWAEFSTGHRSPNGHRPPG